MLNTRSIAIPSLLLTIAACGRPPGTLPRENSAAGHRADAAHTYKTVRTAHLRAAEQLENDVASSCKDDTAMKAGWPAITSSTPYEGGIVVYAPADAGTTEAIDSRIRCRAAVIARDGVDNFPNDPLALDLEVVVHPDANGTAIMLGLADGTQRSELERRVSAVVAP